MITSTNTQLIKNHTIPRTVVSTEAHSWRKRHQGCACDWSGRTGAMLHSRPRHVIYVIYCVSPVLAIYAICAIRYLPDWRPISSEDAHPLYPRYPRVFFMLLFTAHSLTDLCEKGCVAFSPFAKLNWFFSKKMIYLYHCEHLTYCIQL